MALDFAVSSTFKAKDEAVNAAFKKMARGAETFEDRTVKAFKNSSRQASNFGSIVKGILAAGAIQKGFNLLGQGVGIAGKQFLDFDQAITGASAKFTDINVLTEEGRNKLEQLRKTARLVGRDTEHNAAQAASGLDFLAMAGFNAEQSMRLLPGVANLATSANVDFARATDIASDALGAFGLMTSDSAQLAKNFTRVQDVMAKTTTTANTNLEDMFESIKFGAPDFISAGQSVETFSSLVGVMANSGIKGSESGTKLRNMAIRLAAPTKEAGEWMKKLGIRVSDNQGNFRDFLDIVDDVRKGTAKLGEVQRKQAMAEIFGARQTGALDIILQQTDEQLRSYRQSLIDSQGASEKMAEIMRSSLMNRLKSLGSAAIEVGFQLFDAFDEQGAEAINRFTLFLRDVDLKPTIEDAKLLASQFSDITTSTKAWDQLGNTLLQFKATIGSVGNLFGTIFDKIPGFKTFKENISLIDIALSPLTSTLKNIELKLKGIKWLIDNITIPGMDIFSGSQATRKQRLSFGGRNLHEIIRDDGLGGAMSAISGGSDYSNRTSIQQDRLQNIKHQRIDIGGTLNIVGAPEGSSYKPSSPAPPIDTRFTAAPQGL